MEQAHRKGSHAAQGIKTIQADRLGNGTQRIGCSAHEDLPEASPIGVDPARQSPDLHKLGKNGVEAGGRIVSIQHARAIAALAVLLSHAAADAHLRPTALIATGAAGVDLFFIVSGFVMVHSSSNLFGLPNARRLFLGRRFWRVIPFYWAATGAFILMQVARGKGLPINLKHLAASLAFLPLPNNAGAVTPIYGIGWTLNYEMFFYLCFATALGMTLTRGLSAIALLLSGMVVLNAVVDLPQPWRFWTHPVLIDFLLGLLMAVLFRRGLRLRGWAAGLAIALGLSAFAGTTLFGIAFSPDEPDKAMLRWLFWGIPAGLCFAGLVLRRTANERPHPAFVLLGNASYILYLVHPMVIILLRPVLPAITAALGGNGVAAGLIQVAMDVSAAVACAILLHLGVERPLLRARRRPAPTMASPAVEAT